MDVPFDGTTTFFLWLCIQVSCHSWSLGFHYWYLTIFTFLRFFLNRLFVLFIVSLRDCFYISQYRRYPIFVTWQHLDLLLNAFSFSDFLSKIVSLSLMMNYFSPFTLGCIWNTNLPFWSLLCLIVPLAISRLSLPRSCNCVSAYAERS